MGRELGPAIAVITDVARFRPEDPDALVSASLACPLCLRSEELHFTATLEGYDPRVDCVCPSCLERWRVYLDPQQALRLGLLTAHAGA